MLRAQNSRQEQQEQAELVPLLLAQQPALAVDRKTTRPKWMKPKDRTGTLDHARPDWRKPRFLVGV